MTQSNRIPKIPCRGPSRRSLLKAGMLTAFGLGLDDLFRLQSLGAGSGGVKPTKVKHCILIWMAGGPSHIDTFDPKPDAPSDVKGEFKPIDTAVPGLRISEVFPNLAKMMDRVTLIRSVTSPEADHDRAAHHLLTGYRPSPALVYPSFGSVVSKTLENTRGALPPYVAMPDAPIFASSGYLTPAFDPFAIGGDANSEAFRVQNLTPPDEVTLERLNRRRGMVKRLDGFAHDVAATSLVTSRDQFSDRAYDLLTSSKAQAAFRIGDETPEMRQAYGRNPFGQSCLLARRLVQSGVSFVTINNRGPALQWDTHAQNFPAIRDTLAPPLDLGLSTLLDDLKRLGLLDETLVIAMGEFGPDPQDQCQRGTRPSRPGQLGLTRRSRDSQGGRHRQDRLQGRLARRSADHSGRPRRHPLHLARDRSQLPVRDPRRSAGPAGRRWQGAP